MTNPFPHLKDEESADDYTLSVKSSPSAEDLATLKKNMTDAWPHDVPLDRKDISILIKDKDGQMIAGFYGHTESTWLYIKYLWVDEAHQKQGIASKLLRGAEKEAKRRGCQSVHVSTYSFQALPFYVKNGYTVFGELDHYPDTHSRYYLQKKLR